MHTLPMAIATLIGAFAPLISRRVFEHTKLLVVVTILAPGKRTVTFVLRVMGRSGDEHFQNCHRVFCRAQCLPLEGRCLLLGLLLNILVRKGLVVIGVD
jgi:hypothetical protein